MTTLLDTSAIIAVLSASDANHERAGKAWLELVGGTDRLVISGYSLIEAIAILHNRFGTEGARSFLCTMGSVLEVIWPDGDAHESAMNAMLATPGKGGPSLVDCASFEIMRRHGIERAFAYDRHFLNRSFDLVG